MLQDGNVVDSGTCWAVEKGFVMAVQQPRMDTKDLHLLLVRRASGGDADSDYVDNIPAH